MSINLVDDEGRTLKVNTWNWGVLHHTIVCARPPLFSDADFLEQLRDGGTELSANQVDSVREYLEEVVMPRIGPGQRLLPDFSVTDEPDDGTFFRDELERNYSLHHDVLVTIIEFLRRAHSPVVIT